MRGEEGSDRVLPSQHRFDHGELLLVDGLDAEHALRDVADRVVRVLGLALNRLARLLHAVAPLEGLFHEFGDALLLRSFRRAVDHLHECLDVVQLLLTPLSVVYRTVLQLLLPVLFELLLRTRRLRSRHLLDHADHVAAVAVLPEEEPTGPAVLVAAAVELASVVLPCLLHCT